MKELAEVIGTVNQFTPLGIIGLLAYIIYLLVKSGYISFNKKEPNKDENGDPITFLSLHKSIKLLGSNHFHEVKDSLARVEKLLEKQTDKLDDIDKSIAILNQKIK